jgi:NADH dehydrogenase [ubiquinone] 1 alpha subcomplex assembly factor 7
LIVLANEFFDALPIRQLVLTERGWCERLVGLSADGALTFGLAAEPDRSLSLRLPLDATVELSPQRVSLVEDLARRLERSGGAALIVDYGPMRSGFGDSLQAVSRHGYADPLAAPGVADLTAHVDFAALARAALAAGAAVHGPVRQGDFLTALGIGVRAGRLKDGADERRREMIDEALSRLVGHGKADMGALFKVMALGAARLPLLPGFESRQSPDKGVVTAAAVEPQ